MTSWMRPSRRICDIQSGEGSTGGRGTQRLPKYMLSKTAQLIHETWEEGEHQLEYCYAKAHGRLGDA